MKRSWVYVTVVAAAAMVVIPALVLGQDGKKAEPAPAGKCMTCHRSINPGLYHQWYDSEHAKHNVTCIDCHGANKGDPDAFEHEGALVATLVTPKDCGRCHEKEMREVDGSHHAKAGLILDRVAGDRCRSPAPTPPAMPFGRRRFTKCAQGAYVPPEGSRIPCRQA